MQFSTLTGAVAAFAAMALASPLDARDKVKLNQYRTMDDCLNDRNILYHAAPVSGKCYNIDDATGAFFLNTGGYLATSGWNKKDCYSFADVGYGGYTGKCYDKGSIRSIRVQ